MKRWAIAFAAVVLGCIPVLLNRARGDGLLRDTDTAVLLARLREPIDSLTGRPMEWWVWFVHDWPLHNRFYRPLPTLVFDLDQRLYGTTGSGYGLTNALLAVACILLTFWLARELTDRPGLSAAAALVFAAWHVGPPAWVYNVLGWIALITFAIAALRHRTNVALVAGGPLALGFLVNELAGRENMSNHIVQWLPGRTASVMAVFVLAAMAAYARYERLGNAPAPRDPGPLDPPATRNTEVRQSRRASPFWPVLATLCTAAALGSYEQAVMLPAALLGIACTFRLGGWRVRWGWQALFWGLLVGYVAFRAQIIPPAPSGYQKQQLRDGPGVWLDLLTYAAPGASSLINLSSIAELGLSLLLTPHPYQVVLALARLPAAVVAALREWRLALAGYALSFLAFLPMAWLKPFGHYHYWPMALRSLLVVALGVGTVRLILNAWSPPVRQAPPRRDPAPGSLPRP